MPGVTLQAAVEEYLIEQQVRGNSKKTLRYYRQALGYFAKFTGPIPVADLTLLLCKTYYIHLTNTGISSNSTQTYIRALRAFLTWCFHEGYTPEDISQRFRLPKAQRKTIDTIPPLNPCNYRLDMV